MNELIFFIHVLIITLFSIGFLKTGKEALVGFVCTLGILSNLFVSKQASFFGFNVTCSDVFAVGVLIGLNILQEYHGKKITQKAIWISFAMLSFYLIMTQIHILYIPNHFDSMHDHFKEIFSLMPRLTISSICVYLAVQHLDAFIFGLLKKVFNDRFFGFRSLISLSISQFLDTILFSFLALYGVVGNIWHIVFFSFAIKVIVILFATPLITFTKKLIPPNSIKYE